MKTLLGDWEDSTDVLEYHAEQATKQKYLKFHQNHLKENRLKLYIYDIPLIIVSGLEMSLISGDEIFPC